MRRTAQTIEATSTESQKAAKTSGKVDRRGTHPNSLANLKPYEFKPGESGNPGGKKRDVAADICRAIFEGNPELIYQALGNEIIKKGSAYAFQVASDRAYGKLKQTNVHQGDEEGGPISANLTVTFVKPEDSTKK